MRTGCLWRKPKLIDLVSLWEGRSALDLQRLSKEPFAGAPLVLPIKMKLSSRMIDSRLPRKGCAIIFLPLLRRSYLSYEDTIERVQLGLSRRLRGYQGGTFLTLSILNGVGSLHICASLWRGWCCRFYSRFKSQWNWSIWLLRSNGISPNGAAN